ncbi:long-chain-fatty-acid-CoA ligase/ protein binding protein [Eremomyces bilateralis CBS 781.70]|uniref:Long-chain-fatty-acid-CoA ligase/ protein binding protein n=1 Tax=Eremomyces bilateralis CBS 781.70 TaxID=1392243 RepID=A0A6G1FZ48_9PEZI|nr:long-chain-fatty-acid-CoA ligase/ protein binding protein [Eremomyces bilateralis CBS 781.70]KAF1811064.1 long-chain-fatty-acid-CoA ligase/ protein binding protein [Eremomyces bilateralis CBS 781.70]
MFGVHNPAIENAKAFQAPPKPGAPYSVPIAGTARPGRTPIYRHFRFQDKLLETFDPEVRTIHDSFEVSSKLYPTNRCLGYRPWDPKSRTFGDYLWESYKQIAERRNNFGSGIVQLHKELGVTDAKYGVGLFCNNRPEWQITDLGCMSQGLYTVSIYDTLGPSATEYIINHASLNCVVTSLNHIPALLQIKASADLPQFRLIISLEPLDTGDIPGHSKRDILAAFASKVGIKIITMAEVEALGALKPLAPNPPAPTDLITINYTSGTTGDPKGVMLTHSAAVSATAASMTSVEQSPQDIICSFLPLAHIYQRIGEHCALWAGAAIGYFHGNVAELVDDLKLIRPTAFSGVPRLYNRFGSAIKAASVQAPGFRGTLSNYVINTKTANLARPEGGKDGEPTNKHAVWDRVWGRKVAAALGLDRCRTMISGSAPIDPTLHQFLRVVFANNFLQGYGLTETYACSLIQVPGDLSAGNCGAVSPCIEAVLRDVEDMGYTTADKPHPRGELWLRGNSRLVAYYKNDAETAKAIDEDGWFRTGDICEIDSRGRFKVIDRAKNVLKLAQGEYVSPERIENVFLANLGWLMTAFVHGDSTESSLVGIFGVDPAPFAAWASAALKENISGEDINALRGTLKRPDVREKVVAELRKVARKSKLNRFEECKGVRLHLEPFTVDNGLLTPTLKLKRPQTAKTFRTDIDDMYAEIAAEDAKKPQKLLAKL